MPQDIQSLVWFAFLVVGGVLWVFIQRTLTQMVEIEKAVGALSGDYISRKDFERYRSEVHTTINAHRSDLFAAIESVRVNEIKELHDILRDETRRFHDQQVAMEGRIVAKLDSLKTEAMRRTP